MIASEESLALCWMQILDYTKQLVLRK